MPEVGGDVPRGGVVAPTPGVRVPDTTKPSFDPPTRGALPGAVRPSVPPRVGPEVSKPTIESPRFAPETRKPAFDAPRIDRPGPPVSLGAGKGETRVPAIGESRGTTPIVKPVSSEGLRPLVGKGPEAAPAKGVVEGAGRPPALKPEAGGGRDIAPGKGGKPTDIVAPDLAPKPLPPGQAAANAAASAVVNSEASEGLFAASFYAASGTGTVLAVGVSSGHHHAYGATPYAYHHHHVPYWSSCYAPCYAPVWYSPAWCGPAWYPAWYGPSWYTGGYGSAWAPSYCSPSWLGFSYFGSHWRFSVGFGYSYSPYYYSRCWYPFHRRYVYYPYHYYSTIAYYPAYTTVYHEVVTVDYADTADPYVEYVDPVPAAAPTIVEPAPAPAPAPVVTPVTPAEPAPAPAPARSTSVVAEEFLSAITTDVAPGTAEDLIGRGDAWLRGGEYLRAAEAFRQAWVARPTDAYPAMQLGLALFASGSRYGLGSFALSEGLERDPLWPRRVLDLRNSFAHVSAFDIAMKDLQKHVLRNPRDGEARFLLAYVYFFTGNEFAAHGEFSALREGGWESPHLATFIEEAERRVGVR